MLYLVFLFSTHLMSLLSISRHLWCQLQCSLVTELAHVAASWLALAFLNPVLETSHQQSPDVGAPNCWDDPVEMGVVPPWISPICCLLGWGTSSSGALGLKRHQTSS